MTPDDRARMRETIRAALGQAVLPDAGLGHPPALEFRPFVQGDLVERFRREVIAVGGDVHEAAGAEAVAALVARLAAAEGGSQVLMWDQEHLPVAGLTAALTRAGLEPVMQVPADVDDADRREALGGIGVGLTAADAGLAATGSIVLASGPGRSRLASLLPPVHVALLRRTAIVDSLAALFAGDPALVTGGSNVVVITGPSRSADIEHTLSRGVHGPKDVYVVLVD